MDRYTMAAHWAKQDKAKATAGNFAFRGPKFFHFGTCIAQLVTTPAGKVVALVSDRKWSDSTTAAQNGCFAAAKEAGLLTFRVDRPEPLHFGNLKAREEQISETLARVERAKSPENYRRAAQTLIADTAAYSDAFGCGWIYGGPAPESVLSKKEREAH